MPASGSGPGAAAAGSEVSIGGLAGPAALRLAAGALACSPQVGWHLQTPVGHSSPLSLQRCTVPRESQLGSNPCTRGGVRYDYE